MVEQKPLPKFEILNSPTPDKSSNEPDRASHVHGCIRDVQQTGSYAPCPFRFLSLIITPRRIYHGAPYPRGLRARVTVANCFGLMPKGWSKRKNSGVG